MNKIEVFTVNTHDGKTTTARFYNHNNEKRYICKSVKVTENDKNINKIGIILSILKTLGVSRRIRNKIEGILIEEYIDYNKNHRLNIFDSWGDEV